MLSRNRAQRVNIINFLENGSSSMEVLKFSFVKIVWFQRELLTKLDVISFLNLNRTCIK